MSDHKAVERETWPHESCFECRLRMPSDGHAEAHYLLTGHPMGWPLSGNEMDWPVANTPNEDRDA